MNALGLIEVIGMTAAVAAADTAVKSANVTLLGYELAKGRGMVTIKFEGDVGAAKAALEAATIEADRIGTVVSKHLIPRPYKELEKLLSLENTPNGSLPSVNSEEYVRAGSEPEVNEKKQTESSVEEENLDNGESGQEKQRGQGRKKKKMDKEGQQNKKPAVSVTDRLEQK